MKYCLSLALLALFILYFPQGQSQAEREGLIGFTAASSAKQLALETEFERMLSREMAERQLRIFTEEPHMAGTERDRALAEYVRRSWVEYGLDEVKVTEYQVLLPYPEEVKITMLEPFEREASMKEEGWHEDKDSYDSAAGIPYHAYSASGEATAHVVYANSGNPEDYDKLESMGISIKGKIALVRYSVPYSYRGFKALTAERRGAAGILIYSDPADDGYMKGDVYPDGPWGPESHIQRGGIVYDFLVPGDPLTPGWASVEGARRIRREEAQPLPKILSAPLSARDARMFLENLAGPAVPKGWQGGLPFTYHVGPGPAKARMRLKMDDKIRPIWVVTGLLKGSEEPEKLVVIGNHRDAWIYGAVDPSSGSAALMEVARALGALARKGIRPRRSILLASWDAEEFTLTGSTEWGEEHADELSRHAVAYLNVDSAVSGPDFEASAVPSLARFIEETARDVTDPATGRSIYEAWRARVGAGLAPPNRGFLVERRLGSGSDYTVFLNFLGVPIANISFDGPYGVYHSIYDNFYWMSKFGDPGFRYHVAMANLWGRMALRLANADILPFKLSDYAEAVEEYLDEMKKLAGGNKIDLARCFEAARRWKDAARALEEEAERALEAGARQKEKLAAINGKLMAAERALLDKAGIAGRPWYKHLIYAPKFTYAAEVLPGLFEAIEAREWSRAQRAADRLAAALTRAAAGLETAGVESPR